jgi:hypothetical protein
VDDHVYGPMDSNTETSYRQSVWPLPQGTAIHGAVHVAEATNAASSEALRGASATHFLAHWEGEVEGVWSFSPVFQWDTAEEAVDWARSLSPTVFLRVGLGDSTLFSAGEQPAGGLPQWAEDRQGNRDTEAG